MYNRSLSEQQQHRILRRRELESCISLSRSTIYDKIDPDSPRYDPTFPTPIKLGIGATAVGWIESEVQAWLQQQIVTSRAKTTERK